MPAVVPVAELPVISSENIPDDLANDFIALWLIDKPKQWSSFRAVKWLKKTYNLKKVGHAGTLDPMATGLLIMASGRATRSISQIQELPKTYEAIIQLGACTASYDAETPLLERAAFDHVTLPLIEKTLQMQFSGTIEQVPPMYSALKVDGERLYKKARKGETVDRKSRTIQIYSNEILDFSGSEIHLRIQCSKGTYIRSIAHDLGLAMGTFAHLSSLRRTQIGPFNVSKAIVPS